MADQIHVTIVSAEGVKLDQMAHYVYIPSESGAVGVLANHLPMLCAVKDGVLKCHSDQNQVVSFRVKNGIASVAENEVVLMVASAEEEAG